MDRERELWALALWVERRFGADGFHHIAEQIGENAAVGEEDGVALWQAVAERFGQLTRGRRELT